MAIIDIPPLINGKSYEYADIILNIMGQQFFGVTEVEYGEDQDIQNVYGAGNYPVSRGHGKVTPMAKVTLLMEEVESIQSIAPLGRLQRIPEFDIVVTYTDLSLIPRKHVLKNCRFKNNVRSSKTGDTSIAVPLELVISHIKFVS